MRQSIKYLFVSAAFALILTYVFNAISVADFLLNEDEFSIQLEARSSEDIVFTNQYVFGGDAQIGLDDDDLVRHRKYSNSATSNQLLSGNEKWQTLKFKIPTGTEILKFRFQLESESHSLEANGGSFWFEVRKLEVYKNSTSKFKSKSSELFSKLSGSRGLKKVTENGGKIRFSIQKTETVLDYKKGLKWIDVFKEVGTQGSNSWIYWTLFFLTFGFVQIVLSVWKPIVLSSLGTYETSLFLTSATIIVCLNLQMAYPLVESINTEKRDMYATPRLDFLHFDEFLQDLSLFYRGNFGFRNFFIKWNNSFKFNLFGLSPIPKEVIVGKEDWLYKSLLVEDLVMTPQLNSEQLEILCKNVRKTDRKFKAKGIKYYILLPTEKAIIYPEFLPMGLEVRNSLRRQVAEALRENTNVTIIDTEELMLKSKADYFLYYKYDFHWNDIAGFLVYQKLASTLAKDFPSIQPLSWDEVSLESKISEHKGLAYTISMHEQLIENDFRVVPNNGFDWVERKQLKGAPRGTKISFVRNDDLPRAIVVHDSFFAAIHDNIANHFRVGVYIQNEAKLKHSRIEFDNINRFKADIVIHEFMINSEQDILNLFGN